MKTSTKTPMKAPMKTKQRMTWILAAVMAIRIGVLVPNAATQAAQAAQSDPYPKMAPVEQYLMERNAEIQLARTAASDSISRDATILVLGRQGFETAVEGKNGFTCIVERGWTAAFDWPEFWNPKVRAAACLNAQAARFILPIDFLRTKMVLAGRSKAEMLSAVKAAYEKKQLPDLESGGMCYMMSKPAYLTDQDGHTVPHVMFYSVGIDPKDWGSGAAGSPVVSAPYWFFLSHDPTQMKGLPPILVFLVMAPTWSDGTPAAQHQE